MTRFCEGSETTGGSCSAPESPDSCTLAVLKEAMWNAERLLRYVDASLGRELDPPLTAEEALKAQRRKSKKKPAEDLLRSLRAREDGFCDTLDGAMLLPMELCLNMQDCRAPARQLSREPFRSVQFCVLWAPHKDAAREADILINGVPSTSTLEAAELGSRTQKDWAANAH